MVARENEAEEETIRTGTYLFLNPAHLECHPELLRQTHFSFVLNIYSAFYARCTSAPLHSLLV